MTLAIVYIDYYQYPYMSGEKEREIRVQSCKKINWDATIQEQNGQLCIEENPLAGPSCIDLVIWNL